MGLWDAGPGLQTRVQGYARWNTEWKSDAVGSDGRLQDAGADLRRHGEGMVQAWVGAHDRKHISRDQGYQAAGCAKARGGVRVRRRARDERLEQQVEFSAALRGRVRLRCRRSQRAGF